MKKALVVFSALLLAAAATSGQEAKVGIGAFGGLNIPLVQDDQTNGTAYGIMARIKFLPFLNVEPNVMFGKWGEPDPVDGVDLGVDGSKITSFGVDAVLGGMPGVVGFKPYGVLGVGSYKIKNDDTGFDESGLGWSGGLGFGIGFSRKFDIDVRGKLIVAPQDGGSKKALTVTGGVLYYLGGGL